MCFARSERIGERGGNAREIRLKAEGRRSKVQPESGQANETHQADFQPLIAHRQLLVADRQKLFFHRRIETMTLQNQERWVRQREVVVVAFRYSCVNQLMIDH